MEQLELKIFHALHVLASFLTLQLLWLFFSLGVVTIVPATVAMYAVILEWSKKGIDIMTVWRLFFPSFKRHFKDTLFLGINLVVILGCFIIYEKFIPSFFIIIFLFMISPFTFAMLPLLVTSHLKGLKLWKIAGVAAVIILPEMLIMGGIGITFVAIVWFYPLAIAVLASLFAFIHMNLWQHSVKKLPQDLLDQCLLKYRYR
ncbi:YesL family protein [Gracilibacillus sp. S3-1-1]|uniref:YesL family protein n=1 Tax=Gracilibacillus pellucidus TaxID=3095368 RepID=A0ACC6M1H6_9BACI|nr:YesL family protein [Gracilibacillus sp. S3-1-1]MDX8044577.1 YesL family protein [Gracilibacillus sp. S3-1-1]